MTTSQNFFNNIVSLSGNGYNVFDQTVGDMNKNVGLSANFFAQSAQIIGNTISENYDLTSILGQYNTQINSDNTDPLLQSLQNGYQGISYTQSYPNFLVSTHISTTLFNYNGTISSSFLSGQIFNISTSGISTTSVISLTGMSTYFLGSQFKSNLFDVPLDFAVFGLNNFNNNYSGSNLIQFDYTWSYASPPQLLIKLNYPNLQNQYTLCFYWGNSSNNFIATSLINNNFAYIGNLNFLNNIGIYTTNLKNTNCVIFSQRNNFWSNKIPYNINFNNQSFVDKTIYLWANNRVNSLLTDGISAYYQPPVRYQVINNNNFSILSTSNTQYATIYSNFYTTGLLNNTNTNANLNNFYLFNSNKYYNLNFKNINNQYNDYVPVSLLTFQKNPKQTYLNYTNGYTIVNNNNILPYAFVAPIQDINIWNYFSKNIILGKTQYNSYNILKNSITNPLKNFIASFFFAANSNSDINSYFSGNNEQISETALKEFTQPYSYNNIDPINFSEINEKTFYDATNIILSKDYINFSEGQLNVLDNYKLPANNNFEIFKPISYVCNGIDPYNQGTGLAFDYTLNFNFEYDDQTILNKTLYLMASKYLISQNDYQNRINYNLNTYGYYYLADPNSTDTNPYSVTSINEFRLYGYSGLIPDLKDGVTRPILTKVFSPEDNTKYTYDQYVQLLISEGITNPDDINDAIQQYLDEGNSFYTIDLNSFSDKFVTLKNMSICATNYALNTPKYWNDNYPNSNDIYNFEKNSNNSGFTNLTSQIINGGIITAPNTGPNFTIYNVPVGYNNFISSITPNTLGQNLQPGVYTTYVLPSNYTNEQPGKIQYSINNSGILDTTSIKILNSGGGFDFDFDFILNAPGFTTTLSTSYPSIHINMNNLARFTATVNGYSLTSFVQSSPPNNGYLAGFNLNPNCFYGLGYSATSTVNILINNYPTIDSFIVAPSNLPVGALENFYSFSNQQQNYTSINYTTGTLYYTLFEDEIFNPIFITPALSNQSIGYITIYCKLITLNNYVPSGTIQANIYSYDLGTLNLISSSEPIQVSQINNEIYSYLIFPINFNFLNIFQNSTYYVSIKQNLQNCFLNIQGSFSGINTSNFSINSNYIYNDPNSIIVMGGISSNGYDLDLSKSTIGVSSIFGTNNIAISTNSVISYLRKNNNFNYTDNQILLKLSTSYSGINNFIFSNPVSINSLSSTFTGVGFTFNSIIQSNTFINSCEFIFNKPVGTNNVFLSRSLNQYNGNSMIGFAGTTINFNFTFNKIFTQSYNNIYAAFNLNNQSTLPGPNRLREINNINIVDGFWSYTSKNINQSVQIYPRAYISNTGTINTSIISYQYIGPTNNIYLNIGYNSNNVYKQELVTINAYPKWQTTWMSRTLYNLTNFSLTNIINQTYIDSIFYRVGLASTVISSTPGPYAGIFQGTFQPNVPLSNAVPLIINLGTSSAVQVFINNSQQPIIDTFSVLSAGSTTYTATLSTSVIQNPVLFTIHYYTLATAAIELYWNLGFGNSLINSSSSLITSPSPISLNSGIPIDRIVFMNVSKTYSDANSINSGYPPGDSFIIRST